ncbi:hypothetical protein ATG_18760 [Desulfurococcaceae archaeon AG1]|nr:hypothetical protein ATG_18760 [Desulfurococcaceae archaeon AG1]
MGVRSPGDPIPVRLGSDIGAPETPRTTPSHNPRGLAAATPLDPGGPDRYRGGAKPWESYAPERGVADG